MSSFPADSGADLGAVVDGGEPIEMMEPLVIGETSSRRVALADLALELAQRSAGFRRSLPAKTLHSLAGLVRAMNCYYSNLIEGHDTHPIDIERALHGDYSADPKKRDLQLEARAHIEVQQWIDSGGIEGPATTTAAIREMHRRFCAALPPDLLRVEDPGAKEMVDLVPGELRRRNVAVGRHIAISPGAVPRFLARFEAAYGRLGKVDTIICMAAAHHRLVWVHPFLDGNGRVARWMSHATLLDALDTGGVWSVSRGLARNVEEYKSHLAACDLPRRNDLDGRGHLSEERLSEFTAFFLRVCLDQVSFMESLVQPERLRTRILSWAEERVRLGTLPPKAGRLLEAVLFRGELPRADAAGVVGTGERQARRVLAALLEAGVLASQGARGPLRLAFPATVAGSWMPGLFPERVAVGN